MRVVKNKEGRILYTVENRPKPEEHIGLFESIGSIIAFIMMFFFLTILIVALS